MINDYISTQATTPEFSLSFKDIIRDDLELARSYLDRIYWVSAIMTYWNYGCGCSQSSISRLFLENGFKVSQPAVGKRVNASINKLQFELLKPDFKPSYLLKLLKPFFNSTNIEALVLYWNHYTFNQVSRLMGVGSQNYFLSAALSLIERLVTLKSLDAFKPFIIVGDFEAYIDSNFSSFEQFHADFISMCSFFLKISSISLYGSSQFKAISFKFPSD
jgi:hypothetical protein